MRKSKKIQQESSAVRKKLEEIERLHEAALQEETILIENVQAQIKAIETEENVFVGVILTPDDLVNVFKLALVSKENIKIPANIYFNE